MHGTVPVLTGMKVALRKLVLSGLVTTCIGVVCVGASVTATSCTNDDCTEVQWGYSLHEFDGYSINATMRTPEGTFYDPSGQNISGALIDRLTDETQACLAKNFPGGVIPEGFASVSGCQHGNTFTLPIDKKSFIVKVANDWVLSCDGADQLLPKPVEAGSWGCYVKGKLPSEACPCRWRAGVQCPNRLIVTPSFYLYKDVLIRFSTGCADPWVVPQMAECASPTTMPLSMGDDPSNGLLQSR